MSQMTDNEVFVYSVGFCCLSVCVPATMPKDQVEVQANISHPTGIASQWTISEDPTFKGGEPNPCPCNNYPHSRLHYLLNC